MKHTIFERLRQAPLSCPDPALLQDSSVFQAFFTGSPPEQLRLIWGEAVSRWIAASPSGPSQVPITFRPPWAGPFWLEFPAPPFIPRVVQEGRIAIDPWPGPDEWALLAEPLQAWQVQRFLRRLLRLPDLPDQGQGRQRQITASYLAGLGVLVKDARGQQVFQPQPLPHPEVDVLPSVAAILDQLSLGLAAIQTWRWVLFERLGSEAANRISCPWGWLMVSDVLSQDERPAFLPFLLSFPLADGLVDIDQLQRRWQLPRRQALELVEQVRRPLLLVGALALGLLAGGYLVLVSSPSLSSSSGWETLEFP